MSTESVQILSEITTYMKYAKFLPEKNRRETWEEICYRNMDMHLKKYPELYTEIVKVYREFVIPKKILPSMRSMQFAGKPIDLNPARIFNCSYLPVDDYRAFSETMFLLLSGCGVGYSVQSNHVERLPEIKKPSKKKRYVVGDSIAGWADAVKVLMKAYFKGTPEPIFDFSDIREKGALLITSGGKAPGPDPLKACLFKIKLILDNKKDGEKLTTLEVHDIQCHIADSVLAGGIRRSALICLFDLHDQDMLTCKFGNWWELNPQRGRANNSAMVDRRRVTKEEFISLWKKIEASRSGEPGMYLTNDPNDGSNPCVSGDTEILTDDGYKRIDTLVGQKVNVWNGWEWSEVTPEITGENQRMLFVKFSNGKTLNCTRYHTFHIEGSLGQSKVKAEELSIGMRLIKHEFPLTKEGEELRNLNTEEFVTVVDIKENGVEDLVYCFTEPKRNTAIFNGVLTGQCVEIALKPFQFCNLVEINGGNIVDQTDLNERARAASFLGTLQAGYTNFYYLRDIWKKTTEKEALLGVGMTGIASGSVLSLNLSEATRIVLEENERIASKIGINKAARTTCVKPSGTTSIVLGTSSGIHAWHDKFYLRSVRVGKNEAIYTYLSQHIPQLLEDDVFNPAQAVIRIPIKAPEGAIFRDESPIDLLNRTKKFHTEWIKPGHRKGLNTHNVSATVSIKDDQWGEVGEWMWDNRETFAGLSVLPYDGGTYVQAPFETITEERYNELVGYLKTVDLSKVIEIDDNTDLAGELACAGGACEVQ